MMATQYNAGAIAFSGKQEMCEYVGAASCKLTEHMIHGVECDPKKTAVASRLFTRSNPVVNGQDLKTYDHGKFNLAIANCPSAYNGFPVGELWVDYKVSLSKPKLFVSRGLEIDQETFSTSSTVSTGALSTFYQPFLATSICSAQQNNIGCTVANGPGIGQYTITFPASYTGNINICCQTYNLAPSVGPAITSLSFNATGNIVYINDLPSGVNAFSPFCQQGFPVATGAGTNYSTYTEYHIFVSSATTGANNTVVISYIGASVASTSAVQFSCLIQQYNANSLFSSTTRNNWVNSAGAVVTTI